MNKKYAYLVILIITILLSNMRYLGNTAKFNEVDAVSGLGYDGCRVIINEYIESKKG